MIKKTFFATLLGLCVVVSAQAQTTDSNIEVELPPVAEGYTAAGSNGFGFDPNTIPQYPDAVYEFRIKNLRLDMPIDFNYRIPGYIDLYGKRRRDISERAMALSETYFPLFERVFREKGIPETLKYLAVIESALNPNAVSVVGASGLWQFMDYTGKDYGLQNDFFVDDRRDPEKATYAAAEYLADLYKQYHDWMLVLAAYNCGPGNVNKAVRLSGGGTNYWQIYNHLPKETRGYVPSFIAVAYIMNHTEEHNLTARTTTPIPTDIGSTEVHGPLSFKVIAEQTGVSERMIKDLNPIFKENFIPRNGKTYSLKLPSGAYHTFINHRETIYALGIKHNSQQDIINKVLAGKAGGGVMLQNYDGYGIAGLQYTVRSGDRLTSIADAYDCTIEQIKKWNSLPANTVKEGQTIVIYVPESQKENYANVSTDGASKGIPVGANKLTGSYTYHTVKPGESIQTISRKYAMSVETIKRLNNIKDSERVRPGMVLKLIKA
jgi:membrane-bound lytic murein transglycosylase D